MKRDELLEEVKQIVGVDRMASHGEPENNLQPIADLWSARLTHVALEQIGHVLDATLPKETASACKRLFKGHFMFRVTPIEVCMMMDLFKQGRQIGNPRHMDNYMDGIGYQTIAGSIASEATPEIKKEKT